MSGENHIGDGVYLSTDGYHIVLRADGNEIFLDPETYKALLAWVERLKEATKKARSEAGA